MKSIVPLFFIFIVFAACNTEFKPYETESSSIDNSFSATIEVNYETFKGGSTAEAMNAVIKNTMISSISNSTDASESKSLEAALEAFDNEYISFISDFPDSNQQWELIIESEIVYQSEEIITVAINTYQDKGGAHGNDTITLLNFNPVNGSVLKPEDYILNMTGFKSTVETYFFKIVKNNSDFENAEDYFFGEDFHLPNNMGFSEEGIILLYNVYEIASYAQGYTEFTIPYEEISPYLSF